MAFSSSLSLQTLQNYNSHCSHSGVDKENKIYKENIGKFLHLHLRPNSKTEKLSGKIFTVNAYFYLILLQKERTIKEGSLEER